MRIDQSNRVIAALEQKKRGDETIVAMIDAAIRNEKNEQQRRAERQVPHCWTVEVNPTTGAIQCRP